MKLTMGEIRDFFTLNGDYACVPDDLEFEFIPEVIGPSRMRLHQVRPAVCEDGFLSIWFEDLTVDLW